MLEIERKFLVTSDAYKRDATHAVRVKQGYLCATSDRTVRVRVSDDRAWLTIKGPANASGLVRYEWEIVIPQVDGEALLALCEPGVLDKTRHYVPVGSHVFEVDEFHGAHSGLTVAEVELGDEAEQFEQPAWLGAEVTRDRRYRNSELARRAAG